jgi:HTH-type transcriptional regulator / antitoxin HipB
MKTKEVKLKRSENKIANWNDHLDQKYGKVGTETRTAFETKAQAFVIGELIKEERNKANLTE